MEEYANTALSTQSNAFGERYIAELSRHLFAEVDSKTVFFQNFTQNSFLPDSFFVRVLCLEQQSCLLLSLEEVVF